MVGWPRMPSEWAPGWAGQLRWALGCDESEKLDRLLSQARTERSDHGYYNQLLDAGAGNGELAQAVAEVRQIVLRPSLSVVRNDGTTWSTNAMGMRDRPYAVARPAGTFRMAMTGDSIG